MGVAPLPKIIYPSVVMAPAIQTTLQFARQPRNMPAWVKEAIRHDNRATSGVQETIWERTDRFFEGELEYVAFGREVLEWEAFEESALQGIPFDFFFDSAITHATNCVFTQVAVSGSTAIYSYSSVAWNPPTVGMKVVISGFATAGNNVTAKIIATSGGASGTITVVLSTQTNETHAGAGAVSAYTTFYMDDKNMSAAYKVVGQFTFKHRLYEYITWP